MNASDSIVLENTLADAVNLAPSIIIESALFGVLTLLVVFSAVTIVRQGIATRSRIFMCLAMIVMYIASGVHWSVNIYTFMREIRDPVGWATLPPGDEFGWSLITTSALFFGFWISDIVVMWRAVVLWEWSRKVTVPCAILIVVPFVLAVVDVATSHATPTKRSFQPNIYGITALIISLFSNIMSTSLIGFKAWNHHRSTQSFFGSSRTSSTVQNTLILLVESGLLYCVVWALFIVSTVLNKGSFAHTAHTISGVVPQLVGLYPSIIIVLVALQKTHCDRNFTHGLNSGPSVQFAAVSNRSAGLSTGRLEEGHIRGATPDYRLEQTRPDYHRRDLSGDVEDSGVYFSSLIKAKEDDFSSPTFADDSMKHGGLMESDVETPRYAL